MSNRKPTARQVARAIAKANRLAGQAHSADGQQSVKVRADNLLQSGPYGAYVVEGDPNGWGGAGAVVTIYMEPKGAPDDCELPLDYWGDGHEYSCAASDLLGGYYIEFINAAVACVYEA